MTDFQAAYLKLSAARHEKVGRLTATYLCHPFFGKAIVPCCRRKCRRDGVCSGALLRSAHLIAQLQLLQQHGLSSTRGTELPACLAFADDELFAAYEDCRKVLTNEPEPQPEPFWPDYVMSLKLVRRAQRLGIVTTAEPSNSEAGNMDQP